MRLQNISIPTLEEEIRTRLSDHTPCSLKQSFSSPFSFSLYKPLPKPPSHSTAPTRPTPARTSATSPTAAASPTATRKWPRASTPTSTARPPASSEPAAGQDRAKILPFNGPPLLRLNTGPPCSTRTNGHPRARHRAVSAPAFAACRAGTIDVRFFGCGLNYHTVGNVANKTSCIRSGQ